MSLLPLFIEMTGRSCLVVGGGGVATRKVSNLLSSGARVTVIAPEITRQILSETERGLVNWEKRTCQSGDTRGYFLVVAATDDRALNRIITAEAQAEGALVNTVDDQECGSVFFPAVLRRGDLVVGIGTGGKSPYLAGFLRGYLERMLPDHLEAALLELSRFRKGETCQQLTEQEKQLRYRDILHKYHLK